MRNALARTLYELAKADERMMVLVADISPAGAMEDFRREFPTRFINVGVAEQTMIGVAAGLAMRGFKPFCYTIATFALFRAYEFIRCDLAYQNLSVTIVGMGAGLAYPTLGGTHQAIEDVAVAMACPNLTVLAPCDPTEVADCARWCAGRESGGPVYMRIGKAGEPSLPDGVMPWNFGGLRYLHRRVQSRAVSTLFISYGPIAFEAAKAAESLGADMVVLSTLAPLGPEVYFELPQYARVVVVEEASGAPLASKLAPQLRPGEILSFALDRRFPHQYGTREELLAAAGLTAEKIVEALT